MTSITIDACLPDQTPVRTRKVFAFGLIKLKTQPARPAIDSATSDDISVLGLMVIEDEVESKSPSIDDKRA